MAGPIQVKTHIDTHKALAASTLHTGSFDAVYVGTTGNITVINAGVTVEYANAIAGVVHPISGDSITTATTADNMVVMSW